VISTALTCDGDGDGGHEPLGVAVSPNGLFAYVTNSGSGTVSVINTATNAVTATVTVGTTTVRRDRHPQRLLRLRGQLRLGHSQRHQHFLQLGHATVTVGTTPYGVAVTRAV